MSPPLSLPRAWYRHLYVQVLLAVALGILLGYWFPKDHPLRFRVFSLSAVDLEPLGKGFIALVRMIIAPIIFCTVVHGIASMRDLKKLGRLGAKTLIYFEIVSTIALIIGLVIVNVLHPGVGANLTPADPQGQAIRAIHEANEKAHALTTTGFLLNIIPATFFGAFAQGDILQILLLALLTAFAISAMGERGAPVLQFIESASQVFFGIMRIIVCLAPLGALGAMAFTVGSYGLASLGSLAKLMGAFYLTSAIFVFLVLGSIARAAGFSIFRLLAYLKDELLLVLGTSSSETALPGMIRKMERLGCAESTVGLVIPTGYSFNLDGTNIYLTMAAIFLAQATGTPLDLKHQVALLTVAMLSSKGAGAVTGGGFVTLAATLTAVPSIPVESLALIYGIDRFMSECRAITNLIGNGVATIVMARWEGDVSADGVSAALRGEVAEVSPKATPDP